jgi:hypothetical protein
MYAGSWFPRRRNRSPPLAWRIPSRGASPASEWPAADATTAGSLAAVSGDDVAKTFGPRYLFLLPARTLMAQRSEQPRPAIEVSGIQDSEIDRSRVTQRTYTVFYGYVRVELPLPSGYATPCVHRSPGRLASWKSCRLSFSSIARDAERRKKRDHFGNRELRPPAGRTLHCTSPLQRCTLYLK